MLYSYRTPENRQLKSFIIKYIKDINVSSQVVRGTFSITNIRFYKYNIEVDVLFKGELFARKNGDKNVWMPSSIMSDKGVSKIRVNRYIKKGLFDKLESRLEFFGLTSRDYSYIKKIKWI